MKNKKVYLVLTLAILCFGTLMQILIYYGGKSKNDKIRSEYPNVPIDSTVIGIIGYSREDFHSVPKGALLVQLENGIRFSASSYSNPVIDGKIQFNIYLYSFLQRGDSICKPAHKDSLYVFRNDAKYVFYCASKERIDEILMNRNKW